MQSERSRRRAAASDRGRSARERRQPDPARRALARTWVLVALFVATSGQVLDGVRVAEPSEVQTVGTSPLTLEDLIDRARPSAVKLPSAIRAVAAPDARVVIDTNASSFGLRPLHLQGLGGLATLVRAPLGPSAEPTQPPTASGTDRSVDRVVPWDLFAAPGPVTTFLVWADADRISVIDARLVATPTAAWTADDTAARAPGLIPASGEILGREILGREIPGSDVLGALAELSVLLLLTIVGLLVIPRRRLGPAAAIPLGLLVGVAMQAATGMLRLPGLWGLGLVVVVGVAVRAWRVPRSADDGTGSVRSSDQPPSGVPVVPAARGRSRSSIDGATVAVLGWLGVFASTVLWVRLTGAVAVSPDSADYLLGAQLLVQGALGPELVELKRGLGQQSLHAVGIAVGAHGLQALGSVVLVASAGLVALLPSGLRAAAREEGVARPGPAWTSTLLLASAGALLIISSRPLRVMAAYVNSHVLVASLLLALVVLLRLAQDRTGVVPARSWARSEAGVAVAGVIGAVVVLRPEGSVLIALVLLGGLVGGVPRDLLRHGWWALGVATLGWNLVLTAGARVVGVDTPRIVLASLVLGIVALAVPFVTERFGPRGRTWLAVLGLVVIWLAAMALQVAGGEAVRFLDVARINLLEGRGDWGVTAPVLIVVALVALHLSRDARELAPMRWLLLGFVPVTMVAKLGDGLDADGAALDVLLRGGGRIGWGDSVNRMWTHVAFVITVLIVLAVIDRAGRRTQDVRPDVRVIDRGSRRQVAAHDTPGVGRAPGRVGPTVEWRTRSPLLRHMGRTAAALSGITTIVGASVIAQLWDPHYLPVPPDDDVTEVLQTTGDQPIGELLAGTEVRQPITLAASSDPRPGQHRSLVCVELQFVTFDRPAKGSLRVTLATSGAEDSSILDASELTDWGSEQFCLALPDDRPSLEGLTVRIEALEGEIGSSASVTSTAGVGGSTVRSTRDGAGAPARPAGPLAMVVTVHEASSVHNVALRGVIEVVHVSLVPFVIGLLIVAVIGWVRPSRAPR